MFKKKTLLCSLVLLFAMAMPVQAQKPIQLWINGKYVKSDVAPVVENQRTLVPIRIISENLGIQVKWDQATQTVTTYQVTPAGPDFSNSLVLTLGDKRVAKPAQEAAKTGELYYNLDVAPKAVNNRTMVPIRFIAEAYKIKVDWDQQNQTVVIGENYKAPAPKKTPTPKKTPKKVPGIDVTVEELPYRIVEQAPDSIGVVYGKGTFTNNSKYPIKMFDLEGVLPSTNEPTYFTSSDTVLPGETSSNFENFYEKNMRINKISYTYLKDGKEVYVEYDVKLNSYDKY